MNKFIKLTNSEKDTPIYIHLDSISYFYRVITIDFDQEYTHINFKDLNRYLAVKETPEEILKLIEEVQ